MAVADCLPETATGMGPAELEPGWDTSALVPDRSQPPVCAAHSLPCAGPGGNTLGAFSQERRQGHRLCADDCAGLLVLRILAGGTCARAARARLPGDRRLAGGCSLFAGGGCVVLWPCNTSSGYRC